MSKIVMKRLMSYFLIFSLVLSGWVTAGSGQASAQVNYQQIPELLITELVPDSTNVGTADGYEFLEFYNNTNQPINFGEYQIRYRFLESDTLWAHEPNDVIIEPGETIVLWIINTANGHLTAADFNSHYGSNLEEDTQLLKIFSGGMANNRMREVTIATKTGYDLVTAYFNDGIRHAGEDTGVFYKYPEDGSKIMQKISFLEHIGTPGSTEHSVVPNTPVQVDTTTIPSVQNLTTTTAAAPGEDVEIVASASDDRIVTSLQLSYRTDNQAEYTEAYLQNGDNGFRHTIPHMELIGSEQLEYYLTASNGFNQTTTDTYKIDLTGETQSPRLNVNDNEIVSGQVLLRGAAEGAGPDDLTLTIDGQPVNGQPAMEYNAYMLFEAHGINDAVNTITIGKNILYRVPSNTNNYQTLIAPIDAKWLHGGINEIAFRAGDNDKTYFEDDPPSGNLDDFNIRNIRLMLGDGTVIYDPRFTDPNLILDMGDDGRYYPVEYFQFDIPASKLQALSYVWDTTVVSEGNHTIAVTDGANTATAVVQVDNEGPSISSTVVDGQEYKGSFEINVTAQDSVSGVADLEVTLDGEAIEVPYATSSADLAAGNHELAIRAIDEAGNESKRTIAFSTVAEHPDAPVLISPVNGAADVDLAPELKVSVSDPTGDDLSVTFHQAYRYDALNEDHVKVFTNATDYEPPTVRNPEGEVELSSEERANISEADGEYVTVDSTTQFPYLRFQVELEDAVEVGDTVEVSWLGATLPNRKVTMYAWNHTSGKWEALADHIAEDEADFTLEAVVGTEYIENNTVDVLVQDEIPSREDYDFTFVWVADTQFLTELYPHIQQQQYEWIVDNIDNMNMKYMFHSGDLVNEPTAEYQWIRASDYMKMIEDAGLPNGVLAGNHDVGTEVWDYTTYGQYFGEDRYKDLPYYGGSYKNNRGHYDLISAEGNDFIMVHMGWGIEDEDIEWMNEVLAQYPERKAFLNFHGYLIGNGTRAPEGELLYEKVVVPNPNVVAVFNGHYSGSNMKVDHLDDDGDGVAERTVYQMIANYQAREEGGSGFLRLLHFDVENNQIYVNTYSPYLDQYNYFNPKYGVDEFTIDMDLEPKVKRVATNSMEVKHRKVAVIGSAQAVTSGNEASVVWSGLAANTAYSWYALAQDEFSGHTVSDIWTFTTGEDGEGPGEPGEAGLEELHDQLEAYIASGDVQGPLVNQLSNRLGQVQHHYSAGRTAQAYKHLEDFLKHMNNPPMQRHIEEDAKQILEQMAIELLARWDEAER